MSTSMFHETASPMSGAESDGTQFRIAFSRGFLNPKGELSLGDIRLDLLEDVPGLGYTFLGGETAFVAPDQLRGLDAFALLTHRVNADSLAEVDRLAIIARFGVGYDNVDLDACTAKGIAVTITPDGVRRPMASSILALMLALSHRIVEKDRLTRAGAGWSHRLDYMGFGLSGRTLGTIGLGNIGRELLTLARPFGLHYLSHDPYVDPAAVADLGVRLVDLETLLRESDYLVVNCPLTPGTRHLLNAERLSLLKPTAFLINTARGPIVDQVALTTILRERRIQGAALDVFEDEPIDPKDPLLPLENVIVAPHAIGWTDEWARLTGESALGNILKVREGALPDFVVNRDVLQSPLFLEKLDRLRRECGAEEREV